MWLKRALTSLLAASFFLSSSANAEFISSGYGSENDNLISFDTDTGLEWLDLSQTKNLSVNEILQKIESGEFKGFRLATSREVDDMLSKLMPSIFTTTSFYINDTSSPIVDINEAAEFRDLFGSSGGTGTYGLVYTPEYNDQNAVRLVGSNRWSKGDVAYYRSFGEDIYFDDTGLALDMDHKRSDYGIYLVSTGGATWGSLNNEEISGIQNAINASSPFSLGFLLLGALSFISRKKNRANL